MNIPIAAEITQRKQAGTETAIRLTSDALTVDQLIWMLGRLRLQWHDFLLEAGVEPIAPYDPLDIEYRVENRVTEHGKDISLKQSVLAKMYKDRTQIERTNDACKDCGFGHIRARGPVHSDSMTRSILT